MLGRQLVAPQHPRCRMSLRQRWHRRPSCRRPVIARRATNRRRDNNAAACRQPPRQYRHGRPPGDCCSSPGRSSRRRSPPAVTSSTVVIGNTAERCRPPASPSRRPRRGAASPVRAAPSAPHQLRPTAVTSSMTSSSTISTATTPFRSSRHLNHQKSSTALPTFF